MQEFQNLGRYIVRSEKQRCAYGKFEENFEELNKNPVEGFSAGLIDDNDLYRWEVLIIGPPDTLYEGGVFKAHLTFPKDYPLRPPKMKFITEIWHPNVDKNGDVCISILHEPGEDKYGYEKPEERWLPIHTVETIMISVISMLADPNGDSPANVDAAVRWPSLFTLSFLNTIQLDIEYIFLFPKPFKQVKRADASGSSL
ncbi:PREDICTED: ubiquitin-conjugating enzyme E2 G1 [Dipodomys ordii]|uniref:Ubiquitin-conjugating enzyme E2 G1 n=1 Tax=Dipodomys ordii TaxID=10020 RepID=A0A1S3EYU4_DIPOR|nr:PREDICTED: ubiquitin-conjugating enzyme E2 G1 [Dipodomys ordii]